MTNLKIDDKALQLISDFYEIGGGAQVVTELPETGKEHTIYELQEKKVIQSIVVMSNKQMKDDEVFYDEPHFFVFSTTEELQDTFNSITPDENYQEEIYLNYITSEDKLIGAQYLHGAWKFTEAIKSANCKFDVSEILELEENEYVVILKEYLGMYPEGAETAWYTGRLWNDELYVFEKGVTGILLGTPSIGVISYGMCMEELPEIPEGFPKEYVFEYIPYEKIINRQLLNRTIWIFTPKSEEITEISYWIYTNDEWVNVDEIKPQGNVIYGQLTKGSTFDEDRILDCSLTNDEIISYINVGKLVVVNFNDEIDGYMYNYFGGISGYILGESLQFDISNMQIPNEYPNYLIEFNGEKFYLSPQE